MGRWWGGIHLGGAERPTMPRICLCRADHWRKFRVSQWLPQRHHKSVILRWRSLTVFTCFMPHVGYIATSASRIDAGGTCVTYRYSDEYLYMKKVKIAAATTNGGPAHLAAIESDMLSKCPAIVSHCCILRYEDGDPRRPGWITLKVQGATWYAIAKDPDACASITATGQSVDDALALLDLLLSAPDAPWETDDYLMKSRPPGRKR